MKMPKTPSALRKMVTEYYRGLLAQGIPGDLARKLTVEFQKSLMSENRAGPSEST